ncbi:enoyl-CoA hydratase/isomerase family protein [Jongsikchunia kroppenstedtii]|uniref:enoyl-CoA hydratase/isomerase family protein n=1 Tax=Jongsikchunia kroppenstedtii TaxID=1121721 RepID=UPI0003763416|nr:enoyl-CoA hydratase/isomerase family protein [Jongsikchunia kroppenstedtii]
MNTILVTDPIPGLRTLTLNRPHKLNTLTRELVAELNDALTDTESADEIRAVVISGAGRAFSAGLDLNGYGDDYGARYGTTRGDMIRQREIAALIMRVHELPMPVIAAVHGPAVGAGLALALAADIRIASPDSIFSVAFIRAGYSACDLGSSWLLPRIVGAGHAHELMLTGRRFDAAEAERIGLVSAVVDDLAGACENKAREIMANPPFSVELTKVGMWQGVEAGSLRAAIEFENRNQVITSATADRVEATAAFLEHREPNYSGR